MLIYKSILPKLKAAGYNTTRLRDENILSESVLTKLRNNQPVNLRVLEKICFLTKLDISDIVEFVDNSNQACPHEGVEFLHGTEV